VEIMRLMKVASAKKKKDSLPACSRTDGYRMALYASADTAAAGTSVSTLDTA
jgi:hypothetical protein